jgi:hypothetical protein
MKSRILKTMLMACFLFSLTAVTAQAQGGNNLVVDVPFDFTVSGKSLPAGRYAVVRGTQGSADGLRLQSSDGKKAVYVLTKPIQSTDTHEQGAVVFTRYGNQLFLTQVWIAGKSTGREMFKGAGERALQREAAKRRVKPETIALTGQAN